MNKNRLLERSPKSAVFLLCLFPLALLVWNAFSGNLSANPIDDITDTTGRWTLRFLLISLAVRPVRQITGIGKVMQFRRMRTFRFLLLRAPRQYVRCAGLFL